MVDCSTSCRGIESILGIGKLQERIPNGFHRIFGGFIRGVGESFCFNYSISHHWVGFLRLSFIRRSNLGPKFRRAAAARLTPRLRENIQALNKQIGSQLLQPFSRRMIDCSEYFMAPDHDITLMLTSRLDVRAAASASLCQQGFGQVFWVVVFFFFPPKKKQTKMHGLISMSGSRICGSHFKSWQPKN